MSPNDEVRSALADLPITDIEVIATLPHSRVARVVTREQTLIFKQATERAFAASLTRERLVNSRVLEKLAVTVAPRLVSSGGDENTPWLLFEDLSTHFEHLSRTTPLPVDRAVLFARALAELHAQTAGLPLEELLADVAGGISMTDGTGQAGALIDGFVDTDAARAHAGAADLLRAIGNKLEGLVQRMRHISRCLMHGDAHLGNALFSLTSCRLIDWAMAVVGPGEGDLTHAMALNLPRAQAVHIEQAVFEAYAQRCSELGSTTTADQVFARYRLCLCSSVLIAIAMRAVPGLPAAVADRMFDNAVTAALDHDVMTLLDEI